MIGLGLSAPFTLAPSSGPAISGTGGQGDNISGINGGPSWLTQLARANPRETMLMVGVVAVALAIVLRPRRKRKRSK